MKLKTLLKQNKISCVLCNCLENDGVKDLNELKELKSKEIYEILNKSENKRLVRMMMNEVKELLK